MYGWMTRMDDTMNIIITAADPMTMVMIIPVQTQKWEINKCILCMESKYECHKQNKRIFFFFSYP